MKLLSEWYFTFSHRNPRDVEIIETGLPIGVQDFSYSKRKMETI